MHDVVHDVVHDGVHDGVKGGYAPLMLSRPPLDAMPNSMRSKSSSSLS